MIQAWERPPEYPVSPNQNLCWAPLVLPLGPFTLIRPYDSMDPIAFVYPFYTHGDISVRRGTFRLSVALYLEFSGPAMVMTQQRPLCCYLIKS